MCPQVPEEPKRACQGITLSIKLDVVKPFDCGKQNKDVVCALCLPVSTIPIIFMQRERILKAAEVTFGSANNKVVSFSWI